MTTYRAALVLATARLRRAGIVAPAADARRLLAHVAGLLQGALPHDGAPVDPGLLEAALGRRERREPMAFITGRQGFWTLDLAVSPATLIPRADSETLIEAAVAAFPERAAVRRVLDLGTGTGCLLLAALAEFPAAFGVGIDRVQEAAALGRHNARLAGLAGRSAFLAGDWADAVGGRFDLVLCNPPYIPEGAIAGLMPEVSCHEPVTALAGGTDGLAAYARLIPGLPALLGAGGAAILEIGAGQHAAVAALAGLAGFTNVSARSDLGGTARALVLRGAAAT